MEEQPEVNEPLNIVFVVDAAGAERLPVVIRSVRESNPDDALVFWIVSRDPAALDPGTAYCAEATWRFIHLGGHPPVSDFVQDYISNATMDRLLLPRVLPKGRYLYLDYDLVVHRHPLRPLFEKELKHSFAARYVEPIDKHSRFFGERVTDTFDAFNAGVLLFDLPQAGLIFDLAIAYAQHRGYIDQMALNYATREKFDRLTERDNVFAPHYAGKALQSGIIHWPGPHKPWQDDFPDGWHGEIWWEYENAEISHREADAR